MKRTLLIGLLVILALTLSAHLPVQLHSTTPLPLNSNIQSQLDALTKRGFTYRFLDPTTVELTETWSGMKQVKSLKEPSEAEIRAWAAARGVPIIDIDPTAIDTNQYHGWFEYWGRVPLSNGVTSPLVVSDVDRNNLPEVYGVYRVGSLLRSRVYQVENGVSVFLHEYESYPGVSRSIENCDRDSLREVIFSSSGRLTNFEQEGMAALPIQMNFTHDRYGGPSPGFTGIHFSDLDGDNLMDLLYKGSECDSIDSTNCVSKIYVAEYDGEANNYIRTWSTDYGLKGNVSGVGGFAVDDFDGDSKVEFAAVDLIYRKVYVCENIGDNDFALTWQDSTPFANLYYSLSGDVDHDGRPEFFVGATSNGNWTMMYEVDSNNHYSARFIIHLLSGGLFDIPTYRVTDVDGDSLSELIIMSGDYLYVFKSLQDDSYSLWYLKGEDTKDAVQFYDFDNDGREDFIISKIQIDSLGDAIHVADLYRATSLVSVTERKGDQLLIGLDQVYPNPFNSTTVVSYSLSKGNHVVLDVLDLLGQRVETLVDIEQSAGFHSVLWDAADVSSGVYFFRLIVGDQYQVSKALLLR